MFQQPASSKYFRVCFAISIIATSNVSTAGTGQCTQEGLKRIRSVEFKAFFKNKNYAGAGKILRDYLKNGDCYGRLVWPAVDSRDHQRSFDVQALKSYLWTQSDLIYADLMSGDFSECIRLAQTELKQYYSNIIDMANDPKIKKAYEVNLSNCQAQRLIDLKPSSGEKCGFDLGKASLKIATGESAEVIKDYPVSKVEYLYKSSLPSTCIGLVQVDMQTDEDVKARVPFVVVALKEGGGTPKLNIFEGPNGPKSPNRCGDFKLLTYLRRQGGIIYRIQGGYGYCAGGTAAFQYDSLFAFENTGLRELDRIDIVLH